MCDTSLVAIGLTVFLSNNIYGIASPFLPVILEEIGISSTWIGLIFASYAIAGTIVSIGIGGVLDKIGHKQVMATGCLLMAAACVAFGLCKYLDDNTIIIICGIILRALQGSASAMINTTCYSYGAKMYPDNVDKVVALMETMAGTGCVTGPLLGSFIYGLVGFEWTFIGFGIAMAPSAFLVMLLKNPNDAK